MIEIGYDFNIKDINKIKKYKNPTLDIYKNKLTDNSKYKIFLNKLNLIIYQKIIVLNIN